MAKELVELFPEALKKGSLRGVAEGVGKLGTSGRGVVEVVAEGVEGLEKLVLRLAGLREDVLGVLGRAHRLVGELNGRAEL